MAMSNASGGQPWWQMLCLAEAIIPA